MTPWARSPGSRRSPNKCTPAPVTWLVGSSSAFPGQGEALGEMSRAGARGARILGCRESRGVLYLSAEHPSPSTATYFAAERLCARKGLPCRQPSACSFPALAGQEPVFAASRGWLCAGLLPVTAAGRADAGAAAFHSFRGKRVGLCCASRRANWTAAFPINAAGKMVAQAHTVPRLLYRAMLSGPGGSLREWLLCCAHSLYQYTNDFSVKGLFLVRILSLDQE